MITVNDILNQYTEFGILVIKGTNIIIASLPKCDIYNNDRLPAMINWLKQYVNIHNNDNKIDGRYFYTVFDGFREHTPPSLVGGYEYITESTLPLYGNAQFVNKEQLHQKYPLLPYPVIAYGRHKKDDTCITVPNHDFIVQRGFIDMKYNIRKNDIEWNKKINKIYWRGGNNGAIYPIYDKENKANQRTLAVEWSKKHTGISDIDYSRNTSKEEYLKYKYLLDIDGMVNAWSALFWKLSTKSAVFKIDSHWGEWYYKYLKPYVHYIPINGDLSNMEEQYNWAESHEKEVLEIISNANILVDRITYEYSLQSDDIYSSFIQSNIFYKEFNN